MTSFQTTIEPFALESANPSAAGDIFVAKNERSLLTKLGTVVGFVELFGAPERFQERFLEIVNDVKTEYYLPPFDTTTGIEKRFEDCLQRANRRIGRALQESVEKVDIDNVNVLLVLLHNEQIYLSYIGTANAFLFHRKKQHDHAIIDIISQASDKRRKLNPEKLFSSIISGSISNRDHLLFCNESVLEYISQTELLATVCEKSAPAAAHYFQTVLAGGQASNNFYGIIIQPVQPDAAGADPDGRNIERVKMPPRAEPQKSINQLVHTQRLTETHLNPSRLPNWQAIIVRAWQMISQLAGQLGLAIAAAGRTISRSIYNYYRKFKFKLAAKNQTGKGGRQIDGAWCGTPFADDQLDIRPDASSLLPRSNPWTNCAPVMDRRSNTAPHQLASTIIEPETTINTQVPSEKIIPPSKPTKAETHHTIETMPLEHLRPATRTSRSLFGLIAERRPAVKMPTFNLPAGSWRSPANLVSNALNKILAWIYSLSRIQQIILTVVFILLFLFSQSIVWQGQAFGQNGALAKDQLIADIERQLDLAEAQNVFNDESGVRASIAQAQALLEQLPDKKQYAAKRAEIAAKIANLQQALEKITLVAEPTVYSRPAEQNASAKLTGLTRLGANLVTIDTAEQKIYQIKADGQSSSAALGQNITDITSIKSLNNTSALVATKDSIYRYDLTAGTVTPVLTGQNLTALATYGDRIYSLQAGRGQIYRHTFVGSTLNSGAAWIKDGTDVKAGTALAVDGNIVVGRSDGSLTYLANGAKQSIDFQPMNPALHPDDIQTSDTAKYIYALDKANKRIAVYEKTGALKTQFQSPKWNDIQSMVVVENEKKIYLLADNVVYQLDINF